MDFKQVVQLVSFLSVTTITCVAFGGLISFSPVRKQLSARLYTEVQQRFIRAVDGFMKVLYPIALVATLGAVILLWGDGSRADWTIVGMVMLFAGFLTTIMLDLPLNKEFLGWSATNPPQNWEQIRAKWESINKLRALLLLAATVSLYLAGLLK
jgi:uncharacterized membrane protein